MLEAARCLSWSHLISYGSSSDAPTLPLFPFSHIIHHNIMYTCTNTLKTALTHTDSAHTCKYIDDKDKVSQFPFLSPMVPVLHIIPLLTLLKYFNWSIFNFEPFPLKVSRLSPMIPVLCIPALNFFSPTSTIASLLLTYESPKTSNESPKTSSESSRPAQWVLPSCFSCS